MGTCKSCGIVLDDAELEDRICKECRKLIYGKEWQTSQISSAINYLNFSSWLMLFLSFVAGGFVLFNQSYKLGIIYGIAILFQGIFLSSLGFTIVYIAKMISKKENIETI